MLNRPTIARAFARHFPALHPVSSPFDRVFEDLWSGNASPEQRRTAPVYPPMNAWEDETAIHVEAELPGYGEKDVEISLNGNELTICGSRNTSHPSGALLHHMERATGRFSRTVRLGTEIDGSKVSAKFDAGVLTITMPKREQAKPRKIPVTET